MEAYKQEFIEFMVESDVLKFGEFTLKSGRKSPFFMNAGAYVTGDQLHRLGLYYAQAIHDNFGLDFDVVFGPAYKGIPPKRCYRRWQSMSSTAKKFVIVLIVKRLKITAIRAFCLAVTLTTEIVLLWLKM